MSGLSKVEVLGAGPAGLYTAILLRRLMPHVHVRVSEQNPEGATFGFGVVFSDQALDFLKADDPDIHELVTPHMERWQNMTLNLPSERITLDGVGFSAIGRLELNRDPPPPGGVAGCRVALRTCGLVAGRVRCGPDRRCGRPQLARAAGASGRVRAEAGSFRQPLRLVRHAARLRHADPELRPDRQGRAQRASTTATLPTAAPSSSNATTRPTAPMAFQR